MFIMERSSIVLAFILFTFDYTRCFVSRFNNEDPTEKQSQDIEGRGICHLPDGTPGTCTELNHCYMAKKIKNEANHEDQEFLKSEDCPMENKIEYICCPDDDDEPDPEVTHHPPPAGHSNTNQRLEDICGIVSIKRTENKIIGGQPAVLDAWPWMVALFIEDSVKERVTCGGVLISTEYILTASHCLFHSQHLRPPSDFIARMGDLDISTNADGAQPIDAPVSEVISHPEYDPATSENDVGLLRLAKPITISKSIRPICLPDEELQKEDLAGLWPTVTGWGNLKTGGNQSSTLMEASVQVFSNEECVKDYAKDKEWKRPILDSSLCAGVKSGGKDSCQGDSGGPLMLRKQRKALQWFSIGVVSFGKGCADRNFPGVYARVGEYVNWIKTNAQIE